GADPRRVGSGTGGVEVGGVVQVGAARFAADCGTRFAADCGTRPTADCGTRPTADCGTIPQAEAHRNSAVRSVSNSTVKALSYGRSLNCIYSSVCLVSSGTGRPSMNKYFVSVRASRMSPVVTTTFAILPGSRDPSLSPTPKICAGQIVTDLSASVFESP